MSKLLTGRELQRVFNCFCPFYEGGSLKPEEERGTILAANSNNYWESAAFTQLAAEGEQSPLIVQFSLHANQKVGADPRDLFTAEGVTYQGDSAVRGARINALQMRQLVDAYGADLVAVSLDHFAVPDFIPGEEYESSEASRQGYQRQVEAAGEFLAEKGLHEKADVMGEEMASYLDYLTSEEYQRFRYHFLKTVEVMDPAWGMIDTEDIPHALNFVVTKDIVEGVRNELDNEEMMLEAELGATGKSGDEEAYTPMTGEELESFANLVASFITYTGGEGIAYDIGMKHAARKGELHEPDVNKLKTVQRTIMLNSGIYVPFAQHGGTGTAAVPRGLVGKINVNTAMLVAGSNARFDHFLDNWRGVRSGVKSVCGTDVDTKVYVKAVYEKAKERMTEERGETGTYQTGPKLLKELKKPVF